MVCYLLAVFISFVVSCRGTDFCKEFSKLGDLRGFFPPHVKIMAVTATASPTTRQQIICILGMNRPVMIVKCPDKPNVVYTIKKKKEEIEEAFQPLVDELLEKRTNVDKTIIFCRNYTDCSHIYLFFKSRLKEYLSEPPGYPNIAKFRIVDMFTACNTSNIKNSILASFSSSLGKLRVVVATIAFGLGIDCRDVHRIIHWSPPADCESYIQETGRGGRDGNITHAILY
jgi:ATP-dependent DNA helicase RecQ